MRAPSPHSGRPAVPTASAFIAALTVLTVAAVMTLTTLVPTSVARADTSPPPGLPATVSGDALPTVQENGVVWAQVTVGNIVYATGNFKYTWPAGQPNLAANRTPRANLLAYDITTGQLTTFNHTLNAQGLAIAVSPDHTRLFVGGDFTTVDGQPRNRLVAFDLPSGNRDINFKPSLDAEVSAITASNTTVYAGGSFSRANNLVRTRLAAFTVSGGSATSWGPSADDFKVTALVLTPDQTEVVIGGRFTTLSGRPSPGLGAATTATGAVIAYAANQVIQDDTNSAGITSLSTDGQLVYGSGFSFGAGNFEGTFAVIPDTGQIVWLNDCHGDTYNTFPIGPVLYSVGHPHDCSAIGAYPETKPRTYQHALASTTYATGTNTGPDAYGWNFAGQPDSTVLSWFPTLTDGFYTGINQAAWSVTGTTSYVALGGEFPMVNGKAQAGLVRFAIRALAPNTVGPARSTGLTPALTALGPVGPGGSNAVSLQWTATSDPDNAALTYRVYRDSNLNDPVYSTTVSSTFWSLPILSWVDGGLVAGSTHSYEVRVYDPFGNRVSGSPVSIVA